MKKIWILLILSTMLSCEKEVSLCDNPVINSEGEPMIMRADLGANCGYDQSFYVYLMDQEIKAVLFTDEDHGFPFHLGGSRVVHRSTYRGKGILVEPGLE